ncbi:poly-gamma-glutamate synthase PgsB, partial [Alteribacillus sp. HJP-4]
MLLIFIAVALLIVLGVREKVKHRQIIKSVPLRINVNGIRGKSTVTRLITGVLAEAGYKVAGKTTGTSAKFIHWTGEEDDIIRNPEGPNIKEQKVILKKASDIGANAFVGECMAINPEYQHVLQQSFLQANIGVILNV